MCSADFKTALGKAGMPTAWVNHYTTEDKANPEAHIAYGIENQQIGTVKATSACADRAVAQRRGLLARLLHRILRRRDWPMPPAPIRSPIAGRCSRTSRASQAVLERAAREAGWGTPMPANHARGVAIFECFQTIVAEVAEVEVKPDGTLKVHRITAAVDAGTAVNPDGLKAQVEGAIIYGLSAALDGAITIDQGAVQQGNFPDYEVVRLQTCPAIDVHIVNSDAPYGGGGEPGTPPVAPAVTNAIFAATGVRIRDLPIRGHKLRGSARQSAEL